MATKGLSPKEIEYIPDLFDGIQCQIDKLLLERREDIFRELKSATAKAIETGEDCGKVEVKVRTVITSGGIVCGFKTSLEYVTQFKVKDESPSEIFDPSSPDLFDKDGNANNFSSSVDNDGKTIEHDNSKLLAENNQTFLGTTENESGN